MLTVNRSPHIVLSLLNVILDITLGIGGMLALEIALLPLLNHPGRWLPMAQTMSGNLDVKSTDAASVLMQLTIAILSISIPALLLYWYRRRATLAEKQEAYRALGGRRAWLSIVITVCGIVIGNQSAIFFAGLLGIRVSPNNAQLINQGLAYWPWVTVAFVAVLAPAYEELFFRRVLFGRLWTAGWPKLGLWLSSLLFAFVHEIPSLSRQGALETFFLWGVYFGIGAGLCYVYWKTQALWAAIIAHSANNSIALAALYFGSVQSS